MHAKSTKTFSRENVHSQINLSSVESEGWRHLKDNSEYRVRLEVSIVCELTIESEANPKRLPYI